VSSQAEKIDKIFKITSKIDRELALAIKDLLQQRKEIDEMRPELTKLIAYKNRAMGAIWLGAIVLSTAISLLIKFA
jgi:hypothetical protein